jgi:Protein of unknown function (DUF1573)
MPKKLLFVMIFMILVFASGVLLLVTRQAKPPVMISRTDPPKIRLEEKLHQFGSVDAGVVIPSVFKIYNLGGEPLTVKDVSATCSCLSLNLKNSSIDPGKTGDLEVTLDTGSLQGNIHEGIELYTNDPRNPEETLYLEATVNPPAPKKESAD